MTFTTGLGRRYHTSPLSYFHNIFHLCFPIGLWPGGTYYTDCAGGVHSKWPALRRCGCGLALLCADGSLNFAGLFPLAGSPQTVSRAELVAIIVVLLVLFPGVCATIYTDSALCSKGFAPKHRAGDNSELWDMLWRAIANTNLSVQITWMKAHGLEHRELIQQTGLTFHQLVGNAIADKLADRAAIESELDPDLVKQVLDLYAPTQKIQLRHIAILTDFHEAPRPNYLKHVQPVALQNSFYIVCSLHTIVLTRPKASCAKCVGGASGLNAIKVWCGTPCCGTAPKVNHRSDDRTKPQRLTIHIPTLVRGVQIHSSHSLVVYKGIIYCSV